MNFPRASGILLHPTSLPGRLGIGDFGPAAYRFVDFLQESAQKLWQVLPLNPTGLADSPFQCFSASAGNPLLISLEKLVEQGVLAKSDLKNVPEFPQDNVDFDAVSHYGSKRVNQVRDFLKRESTMAQRDGARGFQHVTALPQKSRCLGFGFATRVGFAAWLCLAVC